MTFKIKAKRWVPKRLTDPNATKIIKCKFCRQPITLSYASVGRDGKVFACNPDGTKHVDETEKIGGHRKLLS